MKKESNFIIIPFPGGEKSAARMAVLRDMMEGHFSNVDYLDAWFWKLNVNEQINAIKSRLKTDYNVIVFVPGYLAPKYIPYYLLCCLQLMKPIISAVIWYMVDSVERQGNARNLSAEEYLSYGDFVDQIYTFDFHDSRKYKIPFLQRPVVHFPYEKVSLSQPKVFFIGRDKGRLERLKKINRFLRENGISCDFRVFKDAEMDMDDIGDIHFTSYIKYDDVIALMKDATCLLSLAGKGNHMLPLSYEESIIYNKKLITDCDFLEELPLYDSAYQKSFHTPEDIDIDWLKDMAPVQYDYHGEFRTERFLEQIEDRFYQGDLNRCSYLNRLRCAEVFTYSGHFAKRGWVILSKNQCEIVEQTQLEAVMLMGIPRECKLTLEIMQRKGGFQKQQNEYPFLVAGSTGKGDPILNFKISQASESEFRFLYRAFVSGVGWTKECEEDEVCGVSAETSNVLFGIMIRMVPKDSAMEADRGR